MKPISSFARDTSIPEDSDSCLSGSIESEKRRNHVGASGFTTSLRTEDAMRFNRNGIGLPKQLTRCDNAPQSVAQLLAQLTPAISRGVGHTHGTRAYCVNAKVSNGPSGPPLCFPTRKRNSLVAARDEIRLSRPHRDDQMYIPSIFCLVGLPRRAACNRHEHRLGDASLIVEPSASAQANLTMPYGAMARLILCYLSTVAIRQGSRKMQVGKSAAEFLSLIGLDSQGARYVSMRRQIGLLLNCTFHLGYRERVVSLELADDAQSQMKSFGAGKVWPETLTLSAAFFDFIGQHRVPLDRRALTALKGSSLAIDVYAWLAYRLHSLDRDPVRVTWSSLKAKFGLDYVGKRAKQDFQQNFLSALGQVSVVYPASRIKVISVGLELRRSPPPVPKRPEVAPKAANAD